MTATATRAEIDRLRRQANELAQSDSPAWLTLSRHLFTQAQQLEASLRIPVTQVPAIDIEACSRAAKQALTARVLATVDPKLRAALEDIQAGRLSSRVWPPLPINRNAQ